MGRVAATALWMLLVVPVALLASSVASAKSAEWQFGSAIGEPGAAVEVPVSLTGDGRTTEAQVDRLFDESRLALAPPPRALRGNERAGGSCALTASGRITVLRLSANGEVARAVAPEARRLT